MNTQENDKSEAKELRQKAEDELKKRKSTNLYSEFDNLKLIHELQVHQIELEMQNEELVESNERAETISGKFKDLYDFGPSGYITLSSDGDIIDLNFAAAKLLGKNRIQLKNTRFGLYVHPDSLNIFNKSFYETFSMNSKQTCELYFKSEHDTQTCVHIESVTSENKDQCLLTMLDITERKKLEDKLLDTLNELKRLNSYFLSRELRMFDLKKEINELLINSGCEKEYLI